MKNSYKLLFTLSFLAGVLILFVSVSGMISRNIYSAEQPIWQAQCFGQDTINALLIVPCLMISALLLRSGHFLGKLMWPGTMLYLIYTFVIYCFNVRFNTFFIEYCLILGLSIYSLLFFLYTEARKTDRFEEQNSVVFKITAVYFLITGALFYFVWLSDIVPAIRTHTIPISILQAGLATNPVHVIDLSVILPLFIIAGTLLWRKKESGVLVSSPLLFFTILMDLTIVYLNVVMGNSIVLIYVFATLSLISLALFISLVRYFRIGYSNSSKTEAST